MKKDENIVSVDCCVDGTLARAAKHCTPQGYVAIEIDKWLDLLHEEMRKNNFEPTRYIIHISAKRDS